MRGSIRISHTSFDTYQCSYSTSPPMHAASSFRMTAPIAFFPVCTFITPLQGHNGLYSAARLNRLVGFVLPSGDTGLAIGDERMKMVSQELSWRLFMVYFPLELECALLSILVYNTSFCFLSRNQIKER
jgi:hypothetical protein